MVFRSHAPWLLACLGGVFAGGCGPGGEFGDADAAPADAAPLDYDASLAPETLSQSGLYADTAAGVLGPGVRVYEPRFELWSDGAEKQRWIALPDGAQIDNTEGDFWTYPEGTRVWKQFAKDGVKLETRLLFKDGPAAGDWYVMSYVWNDDETDAIAAPGGELNARGMGHRVPSQADCRECHEPMHDVVLGFSAIQLDRDPAEAGADITLDDLLTEGRLLYGTGSAGYPHYPLPGSESEREVLGYLHGNCSGCHNRRSPVLAEVGARPLLLARTSERYRSSVEATPAYESTVGVRAISTDEARSLIAPGAPDDSAVYLRMSSRAPTLMMPPLGSEIVDEEATTGVRTWIESMPAAAGAAATPAR